MIRDVEENGGDHSEPPVQWLPCPDSTRLAYWRSPGTAARLPGVMFCGGFMSDMTGTKAVWLEAFCRTHGQPFVRFDYQGHGASDGRFADGTIGRWTADALAVLDAATDGPQILVGSSMGGWIAVLAALARPRRVAGLVGIAAAPDFTEDVLWPWIEADAARHAALRRDRQVRYNSAYSDEPYVITLRLLEEARDHLVLRGPIALACPVRLIHGMADADVPWRQSLRLAESLAGGDVRLTLVKDAEHRLSRERDLALLGAAVAELSTPAG